MSRLLFVALAVCLLVSGASASTFCLGSAPSLAKGANCGNAAAPCKTGLYCDDTATCQPQLSSGSKCVANGDCLNGACVGIGTSGTGTCKTYASLGQACEVSSGTYLTNPPCGGSFQCILAVCTGGHFGDKCSGNADCGNSNFNCTNGYCGAPSVGGFCNATLTACAPNAYCDLAVNPSVCASRKTQGTCGQTSDCAAGYYCGNYFDGESTQQCIPKNSIAAGKYCGGINDICQSGRCDNNYCASGSNQYCSGGDCASGQICTCDGLPWNNNGQNGYVGTCTNDPCFGVEQTLVQCIDQNCGACEIGYCPTDTSGFSGTCVERLCSTQYTAYWDCAGASPLAVSLLFTALFALLASFLSKEF